MILWFVYTCSEPRLPRPDLVGKSRLPLLFPATRSLTPLPAILRKLFQVPYPVSPAFATLTKTPGCGGHSSGAQTATHLGRVPETIPFLFKLLRTLVHNGRLSTLCLSISCALFSSRRRVCTPPPRRFDFGGSNVQTFLVPLNTLSATLMNLRANVANKRLTAQAKLFKCNTYKKVGGGWLLSFIVSVRR